MAKTRMLPEASKNLSKLMAREYMDMHQRAAQGVPVVWIAIIVPIEILKGFDLVICVPENHAAACAAKGVGPRQCEAAEQQGYSMDLCSYARIDLGTAFQGGQGSPTMGMPKPDILISNNNNCSLLVKWFEVHQRMTGARHFALDIPFCYEPQKEKDLLYIVDQYKEMIRFIEQATGQTFDLEKVRQSLEHSRQISRLWKCFLGLAANKPSGITAFDTFAHMAPFITSWRGSKELADHLTLVCEEAEQQVAKGQVPVPKERYRLLWDNIAPWHQMSTMSSRLREMDANITCATYTSCLGSLEGDIALYDFSLEEDPLYTLARTQNFSMCPHGLNLRLNGMKKIIEQFDIDGVIFASNRSCKVYSVMQMDQKELIRRQTGLPTVMIDVDHADSRKYSEDAAFLRIEALLEEIDAARA